MSVAIVIPARFASTRLPEKMLLSKTGKSLIQHTYEQVLKSKLATRVLIATDDERIKAQALGFNAEVVMTSPLHPTGTDRLSEVAIRYLKKDVELIVNIQGDEPEIEPDNIDKLIRLFQATDAPMCTLVTPFPKGNVSGPGSPLDPNCVKAVLGNAIGHPISQETLGYEALYFSRSLIPYPRDLQGSIQDASQFFMHLGVHSYSPSFLNHYASLAQGKLEQLEKLEQLRILENGYKIVAGIVDKAAPGIDTPDDYQAFLLRHQEKMKHDFCTTS